MTVQPSVNDIYFALVGTAFEPDGTLARALAALGRPHKHTAAQSDYAQRVARTFALGRSEQGPAIALLEGETGLGKTLGYLIPMAVFCAQRGRRGAVAVPLAAVTDPNLEAELALAASVAAELTGRQVAFAPRFAPGDFVARDRITAVRAALPPQREDLQTAVAVLERACDEGARLSDVLRDHGPLPAQIRPADVCGDAGGGDYRDHLAAARAADIVVMPHGLFLDAVNDGLGGETFACAVVDEADQVPAARPDWTSQLVDALCLTSAVLDVDGSDAGFHAVRQRLGLGSHVRDDIGGRLAPPRFGALAFNLSHPSAPRPTVDGDRVSRDNARNPRWYDYVEGVLADIARLGQRTLVLTCGHKDTAELARRLAARKIAAIVHRPGDRLSDTLEAFAADPAALLIGANLWERVNLPGLVRHLVVTRLPIGHSDGPALRGLSAEEAERQALAVVMQDARRRLKLGIGRAIRQAGDDAHLWVTDPRFPLPSSLTDNPRLQLPPCDPNHKAFSVCIPERFRSGLFATYPQAALIDPQTGAVPAAGARPVKRRARH